jgi:hypothetical protein
MNWLAAGGTTSLRFRLWLRIMRWRYGRAERAGVPKQRDL